jgi:hypothetical protein
VKRIGARSISRCYVSLTTRIACLNLFMHSISKLTNDVGVCLRKRSMVNGPPQLRFSVNLFDIRVQCWEFGSLLIDIGIPEMPY